MRIETVKQSCGFSQLMDWNTFPLDHGHFTSDNSLWDEHLNLVAVIDCVECRRHWKSDATGFVIVKWKCHLEGSERVIQIELIIVLF